MVAPEGATCVRTFVLAKIQYLYWCTRKAHAPAGINSTTQLYLSVLCAHVRLAVMEGHFEPLMLLYSSIIAQLLLSVSTTTVYEYYGIGCAYSLWNQRSKKKKKKKNQATVRPALMHGETFCFLGTCMRAVCSVQPGGRCFAPLLSW